MTSKVIILALSLLLSGCFGSGTIPPSPFPSDADLQDCSYPMRDKNSDASLSDAYLRALGQIEVCNSRLQGVRKAKEEYKKLVEAY